MIKKKRKKKIPTELLAARIANRQLERELLGKGRLEIITNFFPKNILPQNTYE